MLFSEYRWSSVLCASLLALLPGSISTFLTDAYARDGRVLPEVIVTASRTPLSSDKVGATVHVIDEEELEKHGQTYVKDYLARLPGISFAQNGPPGTASTIRMRGAAARYIKVLIDGMDISDPSAPQTSAQFAHLMTGDIERIEVLKGSQSTLYGGDAVAGVISIATKSASREGFSARAHAEAGSYRTGRGAATLSYGGNMGDVTMTVQGLKTAGFSAADKRNGNNEKDGYENLTFSGRGTLNVSDALKVFFSGRSLRSDTEFDDFSFITSLPVDDTAGNRTRTRQLSGLLGAELSLFDRRFLSTLTLQGMEIDRDTSGGFPSAFDSERVKLEYKGLARIHDRFSVMFGAGQENTASRSSGDPVKHKARANSLFAQAIAEPVDNISLTAGFRYDGHDAFGSFNTYRFTGAWFLPATRTKFHASYGKGFRAPSLFELYSPAFGNASLAPEKSTSWDAGIDQKLMDGGLTLSATYFHLNTENLVEFTFPAGYTNVTGKTRRKGVEFAVKADITSHLTTTASYTYTSAREEDGDGLVRTPKHVLTVGADIRPAEKFSFNLTADIVRNTVDAGKARLDNYVLLNGRLAYELNEQFTVYVRGENLLDRKYQTSNGYGTSGLAVYAGLRIRLPD